MATPTRELFPEVIVNEIFNKVKGKSSLAKLSQQIGIPFVGTDSFTFNMDSEIDIVAENGKRSAGGITIAPVKMVPMEVEYSARVSEAFAYASEEEKLPYMKAFNEGFAKKLGRGLDIAALHGINPRTGEHSAVIGDNHFDAQVTQHVDYVAAKADDNIDDAVVSIAEGEINGILMSKVFASDLAKITAGADGPLLYPEFKFGGNPGNLNNTPVDINVTVSKGPATYPDHAIVGDFENAFKWGFGKDVSYRMYDSGDPDNSGNDLAGHGQVLLRATAYLGWGILAPEFFCRVVTPGV